MEIIEPERQLEYACHYFVSMECKTVINKHNWCNRFAFTKVENVWAAQTIVYMENNTTIATNDKTCVVVWVRIYMHSTCTIFSRKRFKYWCIYSNFIDYMWYDAYVSDAIWIRINICYIYCLREIDYSSNLLKASLFPSF